MSRKLTILSFSSVKTIRHDGRGSRHTIY